jgi:hypothetical protein
MVLYFQVENKLFLEINSLNKKINFSSIDTNNLDYFTNFISLISYKYSNV